MLCNNTSSSENISNQKIWLIKLFSLLFLISFGVASCAQGDLIETPVDRDEIILTSYLTRTPTPPAENRDSAQTPTVVPTKIQLPTPTPFVYTVIENDTLTGIAFRYSVSLEELITANPGLDPNFLTIGMTLTVPLEGVVASTLPTPTPIPMNLQPPDCYRLPDRKMQCFVRVDNLQPFAVENVLVQVTLQTMDGERVDTKTIAAPLNIIPVARSMVVSALFDPLPDQEINAFAELLTVIPVEENSPRYLETEVQVQEEGLGLEALSVNIKGNVGLSAEQPNASSVWIVAFAKDENDKIVGFRKWIAPDGLFAGESLNFELTVYSLGTPISSWELLVEARP